MSVSSTLDSESEWTADVATAGEWLSMDLQNETQVCGVVIQSSGSPSTNYYPTEIEVQYAPDNAQFTAVGTFRPDSTSDAYSQLSFAWPVNARYVKIVVKQWHGWPAMRAGVLHKCQDCSAGTFVCSSPPTNSAMCSICPAGKYVDTHTHT